ncbi:MAG TPA: gluconeogenesis factor YvcK family protein [Candidatus Limnocylindrales bacterium]|nr:gluconeogenesis factor YvcK family protein [Candidatus Limnocylindrales bacterium]
MNLRGWLRPGMGVKRWLLLVFFGELGLALAGALFLRQIYRDVDVAGPAQDAVSVVTLQFLPYDARALILAAAGITMFVVGSVRLVRNLMEPFRPGGDAPTPLVEVIYQKRFLARGPRIVAIGGGTGLSALLRGLKEQTSNLTAVVTVADDGGSSGLLRTSLGIPPVGDIRNCIVALADAEPLMADLLQYRFPVGALVSSTDQASSPDPRGHAVGNLLIAALTAIEGGDFEEGVRQMNRVLAVRGHVLPVTAAPLTLHARLADGTEVHGQSHIARRAGIERVWVTPNDVRASDDALRAIAEADAIVMGPGSLFTSILPALLLPQIRDAVLASSALRILVCNVATQLGETTDLDLADHLEALAGHTAPGLVDVVLGNNQFGARTPIDWQAESVRLRWPPRTSPVPKLVLDDVVDADNAHHHDAHKLAAAIARIIERDGSRRRPRIARTA